MNPWAARLACIAFAGASLCHGRIVTAGDTELAVRFDEETQALTLFVAVAGTGIVDGFFAADDPAYSGSHLVLSPSETVLQVGQQALVPGGRPSASVWKSVAASAGDPLWLLPSSAVEASLAGVPSMGFSTGFIESNRLAGDITFLISATPGLSMWSVDFLGRPRFLLEGTVFNDTAMIVLAAHTHEHYSFAFNAPGNYTMHVTVQAEDTEKGLLQASAAYTFAIIPEAGTGFSAVSALLACTLWQRKGL